MIFFIIYPYDTFTEVTGTDLHQPLKFVTWKHPVRPTLDTPLTPMVVQKPNWKVRICGDYKVTVSAQLHVNQHYISRIV